MSLSSENHAQSPYPLLDPEFEVPETLETERFRLRMLTVNDVVKDYDAVMTSNQHLHEIWGPGWPEGLTLEQNLIDLGWHQKEFQRRRSFAYTVVALDESRVLGCVYIYSTRKEGHDAVVYLWARQSELASGMEKELTEAVKAWLASDWPFKNPAMPGTTISNEDWEKLPELKR
jgi:RimJ/RimL family protein N-acetyltransferase